MPDGQWDLVLTLGMLLSVALVAGLLAEAVGLPRVTAYLFVGLGLGPQALHMIPHEHLTYLDPLGKLAMALVLFGMGCRFTLVDVRRILRRVLPLSVGEIGLTAVLVCVGLLLVGESWQAATLFGVLAIATAPATTVLVLKETESEGPITDYAGALVVINNLIAVIAFETLFVGIGWYEGTQPGGVVTALASLTFDILGSLALGFLAGLVVSFSCNLVDDEHWLLLLGGVCTMVLGLCELWHVPYLLTFLAMGTTVANASDQARNIVAALDRMTGLLCVVFFVVHGAELNLQALLASGVIGLTYIGTRSAGKYLGIFFMAGPHHDERRVRRWLGAALLSQAGAAIALSAVASQRDPQLGKHLQDIILGTVVFFEIVGPLLIRQAVLRGGEVPLAHAIHHTSTTPLDEARDLFNRLVVACGFDPWSKRSPTSVTVAELMRKNVTGVPAAANFDELIEILQHSHDNTFPVIDENNTLQGVIRYQDLRVGLFDPEIKDLVRVTDLTEEAHVVLFPEHTVAEAWSQLSGTQDDCIPVVNREGRRLLGIVKRRDLYRLFLSQGNPQPPESQSGRQ